MVFGALSNGNDVAAPIGTPGRRRLSLLGAFEKAHGRDQVADLVRFSFGQLIDLDRHRLGQPWHVGQPAIYLELDPHGRRSVPRLDLYHLAAYKPGSITGARQRLV